VTGEATRSPITGGTGYIGRRLIPVLLALVVAAPPRTSRILTVPDIRRASL